MRTTFLRYTAAGLVNLALVATSTAQSNVDIGLFQNGNSLEVRLRSQAEFDAILSSVLFTVRWERAAGASLGPISQPNGPSTYIPLQPSGGVIEDGGFLYQRFSGLGFETISSTGARWTPGEEYLIATIPMRGNANFAIVNDPWTSVLTNNGNYYVSLGGHDRTGEIYKNAVTAADTEEAFAIMPNPNRGQFTLVIPVNSGEDMWFEIVNSAGQLVHTDKPNAGDRSFRKDMDLTREGAGNYVLRIHRNGSSETHKIIVN